MAEGTGSAKTLRLEVLGLSGTRKASEVRNTVGERKRDELGKVSRH